MPALEDLSKTLVADYVHATAATQNVNISKAIANTGGYE